ncbi:hypothetical protein [Methylovulum psychrotolerans]|uniref:Pyrrolo-quinoline quinone n=1 Tax=Methylovulum psychrotolerans TaxID=1704499 RepID=A0A2S5CQL0_9GAMM|nr:hypothetical protein [Methylovulum psychrotolerans]POZ53037.1 hypothetical protein AADEFJLK_00046 [Methylovulum psychrotolerans]
MLAVNLRISLAVLALAPLAALAGPIWSGYAHDAQHTGVSTVRSQPLQRVRWQTPVDLSPQYAGSELLIHYGSPVVTVANNVIVPVKTGATDGFKLEVRKGSDGTLRYTLATDYSLPPHNWTPSFSPVLTAKNRLYWAGAGGTVYYRDRPDALTGASGQIAFYGLANYTAAKTTYNANIKISTPLVADRAGNVYFGYVALGTTPLNLKSGVAKIAADGTVSFVTATAAAGNDASINHIVMNNAPTLSNNQSKLYFAVSNGNSFGTGYLVAVDTATLAPLAHVRLKDPKSGLDALLPEDGSASATVGPDGDVYFGVLENSFLSHNDRGWLLHFNGALTKTKTPGSFGWDATASVVNAALVPSYTGSSAYLLFTKYNNYVQFADGVNKIAVLDPNAQMPDPVNQSTKVMKEVLTIVGATPEPTAGKPNAVREWCINSAAIDPFSKSVLANSEDGVLYRWDLTTNTLSEQVVLTAGLGEAYTPTLIGADGTVYAINNGTLFAVGQ